MCMAICVWICVYGYVCMAMCVGLCVYGYVCMAMCVSIYPFIYVAMYVFVYVCTQTHIYYSWVPRVIPSDEKHYSIHRRS